MSHVSSHHVTLELQKDYQFLVRFEDVPGKPTLTSDEAPPMGHGDGPNPADLLGAAVGNCLAASLAFCLRKARVEPAGLSASVTTHVTRNEKGRLRVASIDVELTPGMGSAGLQRCQDLFEDFCTVTASIRRGIPVSVSLKERAKSAA